MDSCCVRVCPLASACLCTFWCFFVRSFARCHEVPLLVPVRWSVFHFLRRVSSGADFGDVRVAAVGFRAGKTGGREAERVARRGNGRVQRRTECGEDQPTGSCGGGCLPRMLCFTTGESMQYWV